MRCTADGNGRPHAFTSRGSFQRESWVYRYLQVQQPREPQSPRSRNEERRIPGAGQLMMIDEEMVKTGLPGLLRELSMKDGAFLLEYDLLVKIWWNFRSAHPQFPLLGGVHSIIRNHLDRQRVSLSALWALA